MPDLPQRYSADWIEKLDGRTTLARVVQSRLAELQADLGGLHALSYQERSLTRRAVWLEALIESREAALARGEEIEEGVHTQSINALMGVWKALGLQRRSRDVTDLATYLRSKGAA
jgi:hypothetical protein